MCRCAIMYSGLNIAVQINVERVVRLFTRYEKNPVVGYIIFGKYMGGKKRRSTRDLHIYLKRNLPRVVHQLSLSKGHDVAQFSSPSHLDLWKACSTAMHSLSY